MKIEVKKILNIFKRNLNCVIKFEHHCNYRQNDPWKTYIGLVKAIDEEHRYIYIGHAYNTEKAYLTCGEMGIMFTDEFIDARNIQKISIEEFNIWKSEYKKFHQDILLNKDYDVCNENLKTILF